MKKFGKVLLVAIMTIFMVTGCGLRENIEMNIDKDENVSMSIIMAMDNEMIDSMLSMQNMSSDDSETTEKPAVTDEQRWQYIDSSIDKISDKFTKEKYNEDNYKGYKYTINLGKLSELSVDSSSEKIDLSKLFNGEELNSKSLFVKNGDKYTSNMKFASDSSTNYSSYESSGAKFEINYVMNLPEKPISNNADSTENDGKKLIWSLKEAKDFNVEFSLKASNNIVFIILGCVAGAILIIAALLFILNKKEN